MIDTALIKDRLLYLALQGKLVEQKTTDESASKMVSRVSKELNGVDFKANYDASEIPFDISDNWCWCRLSDIGRTNIGLTYHPEDIVNDGTIVVRSSNIINGKMDYNDIVKVNCSIRDNQYLDNNDIVICARNGSKTLVGKCAIYEGDSRTVAFGAFMAVFRTQFFKYVYYYFQTPVFRRYFSNDDTKQINQVTQSILKNALIPLPPYEEQIRIVDKVEEILAVLDNIDSLQSQYVTNVEVLKSKLIDAGIRGKLTEQLPEDGNAEDLYNQIQDEKARLIKEGRIKKEKSLGDITEDEIPFEIPKNWKWVRLNDVGSWSAGATPSRGNKDYYENGIIPWIKTGELHDGYIDTAEEWITEAALQEYSIRLNPIGSVLIAMYGATIGKLGILNIAATTNQACCACIPIALEKKYLFYFLKSNKERFLDASHGGAQPNISKDIITKAVMPLPPLTEQKRIVDKLETLLGQL